MARELPIKVFKARAEDDRLTEGGGSSNQPSWYLSGDELYNHSNNLLKVIKEIDTIFQNKSEIGDFLPAVLSTHIIDDAIAKSHRGKVNQIFNVNEKNNIIGFSEANSILIKVDNQKDLELVGKNIKSADKFSAGLSAIEEIKLFEPEVEVEVGNVLRVELFNYYDYDLNKLVRRRFESLAEEIGLTAEKARYSSNSIIYKILESSHEQLEVLKTFSGLHSIVDMPVYKTLFDDYGEEIIVDIKPPKKEGFYPVVGVLDSGISRIKHLDQWIDGVETFYTESDIDRSHGTFVSGILLYGDELEGRSLTSSDGFKLFDATIFPRGNSIHEDELLQNVREVIEKYPAINMWHLSIGGESETSINRISHFGAALDELQMNYNILIIKSAGNCLNYKNNAIRKRLKCGSDSVYSLVVGSIAHKQRDNDLAEVDHPSPFTVSGFALGNIIKPDLTHYGGNASPESITGVNSFSISGEYTSSAGTSFSAPRVTALAAELYKRIGSEFDPLLIKALLIHSAKYPTNSVTIDTEDRVKLMGYGIPSSAEEVLFNDPHEITLILNDTLEKGNFIEILDFPFPEDLQEEGYYYGEIHITLVTNPIIDENQGSEYCQSNIDILLGTYDETIDRGSGKTIRNPIGRDMSVNFLNKSIFSERKQKHHQDFHNERLLLDCYKKYQPVKKWVINIDEFNNSPHDRFLLAPKRWYLKITGLYREFTEVRNTGLNQDFCLIITIKDTKRQHNIYQSVSALLNARSFVNNNIQLRERIVVRV